MRRDQRVSRAGLQRHDAEDDQERESDARTIGYGAMLIEGLVGVVAMIAAATLPVGDYYAMNTELANVPGVSRQASSRSARDVEHIDVYEAAHRRNPCAAAPAGR